MKLPREAPTEFGWDGYRAKPTTKQAIATAEALTQWIPTVDGGIYLEGHAGGAEISIEVNADGKVVSVHFERVDLE